MSQHKFSSFSIALIVAIIGFGWGLIAQPVQAASYVWDGGGADSNWSTCANWLPDICPGDADQVNFTSTYSKDSTIDAGWTAGKVTFFVMDGYVGTLTQAASFTVTSTAQIKSGTFVGGTSALTFGGSFIQSGGTFSGGNQTMTITSTFTLSGGTFTAPSGTLKINSGFAPSAGTFNHNNGTIEFTGSSTSTVNVPTTINFYNVNINRADTGTLDGSSGDKLIVNGSLTLTNGKMGKYAVFEVKRDMTMSSGWDGINSGTGSSITINGTAAQAISIASLSAGSNKVSTPTLILNNSLATLFGTGTGTELEFNNVTLHAGTINPGSYKYVTTTTNGTYTYTQDGGTFNGGTGTVSMDKFMLSDPTSGATFNGSSTTNTFYAAFTHTSGGTLNMGTSTTVAALGVPSIWNITQPDTFYNFTVNSAGGLALTITSGTSITNTGTLTLTNGSVNTGTLIAQGNVTEASTYDSGDATLQFNGSANQTFTIPNTSGGDSIFNGDITVNKSGGVVNLVGNKLTLDAANQDLRITAGTFDIAGQGLTISGAGSIFSNDGTLRLHGDETVALTMDTDSGTVEFTGNGNGGADTYTVTTLSPHYYNLSINSTDGATDTFQLGAALDVDGSLVITAGNLDVSGSNYPITIGQNFSNAGTGTFNARAGIVSFDNAANTSVISGTNTFNDFSIVTQDKLINFTAGTTQTITGLFTITGIADHLVTLRSTVAGSQWKLSLQGTQNISYVDVQDSDASLGATAMALIGSVDSHNNKNWVFSVSSSSVYTATGWGWIGNAVEWTGTPDVSTGATPGIIYVNCATVPAAYGGCSVNYAVQLEYGGCGSNCDVSGWAWVGGYDPDHETSAVPLGWINFNPNVTSGTPIAVGDDSTTVGDDRLDAHWNEDTHELYGWARFYSLGRYENELYGAAKANDWGWIQLRGNAPTATGKFGVTFDSTALNFAGWAWNDNGSAGDGITEVSGSGVGWMKFNGVDFAGDWIQTVQGDVYAHSGITATNPAPTGFTNATYLIQSDGSVENFTSLSGDYVTGNEATVPNNNNNNQVYRGLLDSIHVGDLIAAADPADSDIDGDCSDDTLLFGKTEPLDNHIFYCSGSLDVNNSLTFSNGFAGELGAGTVIVNGDLRIHNNMNYNADNTLPNNISALASVAWIVLGHVVIDPTVTQIVGTYVVLGNGTAPHFDTGAGTVALTVSGTVMSRSFSFGRVGIGTIFNPQPSERFIYDGRLVANTPPGLEDWSAVLPSLTSD